jgi:hypothetical protein
VEAAAIFATPVKPGVTKVFGRFKIRMPKGKKPPAFLRLLFGLPHWIMGPRAKLADQDTVMNVKQVSMVCCSWLCAIVAARGGTLLCNCTAKSIGWQELQQPEGYS